MSVFQEEDYIKKFDLGLWKKMLHYAKPYRKYMLRLIFVMIMVGSIDAVFPQMTKYAIDHFIAKGSSKGIGIFAFVYGLLVALQAVNVWQLVSLGGRIEMGMSYDIRKLAFHKLQSLSFSYFDKTPVGWIMARLTSDIGRLSDTIAWSLVDMMWGASMMTAIMIAMFTMNWKLSLVTLSVVPALVLISGFFQQKILRLYRDVRKINSKITGAFNEGIMGARTTKTLVREEKNLGEFEGLTGDMCRSSIKVAVVSSIYMPIVLTMGSIGTGLAIWYGGGKVLIDALSYGTLVAFLSYTVQFFEPVRELSRVFADLQSAQASAERVLSLMDTEADIVDSVEVEKLYGNAFEPNKKNWESITGSITFENVSFSYKGGEEVLQDFNLDVKPGETIALVGETGSGKSTIINLACRFYEPTQGRILIDGIDYKKRSQLWLQSNLGYVLQTPHLFSGTIKENILYGRLDASDEDVYNAAKLVNAHDFIMKLEKGYDTEVGEGGGRLSTGEKQLISFARAVIADPRIFVLDEATSSIDTETELMIQRAIQKVLKGRTSFIVAHRLSTIRSADRILVIRDGKLTEEGSHHQLMKLMGYYYRLYTNQFKEEQEQKLMNA